MNRGHETDDFTEKGIQMASKSMKRVSISDDKSGEIEIKTMTKRFHNHHMRKNKKDNSKCEVTLGTLGTFLYCQWGYKYKYLRKQI